MVHKAYLLPPIRVLWLIIGGRYAKMGFVEIARERECLCVFALSSENRFRTVVLSAAWVVDANPCV